MYKDCKYIGKLKKNVENLETRCPNDSNTGLGGGWEDINPLEPSGYYMYHQP
jgi:hypothetical protein